MSQGTSQKMQTESSPDNPLNFIRSQKLREFFTQKPSYLRSLTPDTSYSTMSGFQKGNPLSLEHLGQEHGDFVHSQKYIPNTHRPSIQKDHKEDEGRVPHHRITRSRSTNELEKMVESAASKDLLTEVNYGRNLGAHGMNTHKTTSKKVNEVNSDQVQRGRTKNREFEENNNKDFNKEKAEQEKRVKQKKQDQVDYLNQSVKKEELDESSNKDNSIHNIIDVMGPSPNHRNFDELDLMNKESAPLSSMPSDENFGVNQFFPGDNKDLLASGKKATSIQTNSPQGNITTTPQRDGNGNINKAGVIQKSGGATDHDHLGSTQATGMLESKPNEGNLKPLPKLGVRQMTFDLIQPSPTTASNFTSSKGLEGSKAQLAEGIRNTYQLYNQDANARLSSSTGSKGESLGPSVPCRFHSSNAISYICIKDNCGELLCPLCLYEHQKTKHVGEYEAIPAFVSDVRQRLGQVRENFFGTIEQIVGLQTLVSDRSRFDLKLVEEIDRVETSLLKYIKQFFDNIREEYSKDLFFDFPKVSDNLNLLHYDLNSAIKNLEEDIQEITKDPQSINPSLLTHIVQKAYVNSSINYKRTLNDIDHRVKQFLKTGSPSTRKLNLELNSNLKSKLAALLSENIRFVDSHPRIGKLQSNEEPLYTKSLRIPEQVSEQIESLTNTENFGKSLQDLEERKERFETEAGRAKDYDKGDSKRPRTISPWKGGQVPGSQLGTLNPANLTNVTNTTNSQRGPKNYFVNKKLADTITNRVLEMYQTVHNNQAIPKGVGDKDLELSGMRFLIEYLERFYGTSKIKIFDPHFFQRLLGIDDLDFSDFGRKDIFLEGVVNDLQTEIGKGRCVFTSYEKIFILARIQSSQWILIEVRSNPKVIILYDFLGKLNKTKFSENVFSLVLEVIRREYNNKLGQNPENYLWERKIASQPTLIVKNSWDTGILALKVLSNCYQNKEFSSGKITINEINLTRKKLDKIFKMYEEKKNHDKFVPI